MERQAICPSLHLDRSNAFEGTEFGSDLMILVLIILVLNDSGLIINDRRRRDRRRLCSSD